MRSNPTQRRVWDPREVRGGNVTIFHHLYSSQPPHPFIMSSSMLIPALVLTYTTCFSYLLRTCLFLAATVQPPCLYLIIYMLPPHVPLVYIRLVYKL